MVKILFATILLAGLSGPLMAAVKVVECEDSNGDRTFERTCPPGTTLVSEKRIATGTDNSASDNNTRNTSPVTLYTIPACGDPCASVKDFFRIEGINFNEKNVETDLEIQAELTALTGDKLQVPTIVIGEQVIIGYKRTDLINALTTSGHIQPEADEETTE